MHDTCDIQILPFGLTYNDSLGVLGRGVSMKANVLLHHGITAAYKEADNRIA